MASVIQGSIRAGESVTRTAERILQKDKPIAIVPRYATELADAAKFARGNGDPNLYEDAVKKWRASVSKLGQGVAKTTGDYTIRSASQQLVNDLRKAKAEQVDKIVDRWVLDKARYHARVLARNEAVEAFRDVQLRSLEGQKWAPGVRWKLSGAHPRPDICDVLANQDLYGLGPGGYPADKVPARHPSCMCLQSTIVDTDYFKRELAALHGTREPARPWESGKRENGNVWLRRQPASVQEAIAGPTRAKLLARGRDVMTGDKSAFAPVHELLGQPKPEQRVLRVDATGIVAADRAKMVQPFPAL